MSEVVVKIRKARRYTKAKLTRLKTQISQFNDEESGLDKEKAETRLERLEEFYQEFGNLQQ